MSTDDFFSSASKELDRKESLIHERQKSSLRLGVLISGSGSNLQALIDAIEDYQLPDVEIALVVSNKADAYGFQRALKHKLPVIYLPWGQPTVGAQFIAPLHPLPDSFVNAYNRPLRSFGGG